MNEKELFNLASKWIRKTWPTDHLSRKDMLAYSISDSEFVAKDNLRELSIKCSGPDYRAGFFNRADAFADRKIIAGFRGNFLDKPCMDDNVISNARNGDMKTFESRLFNRSARGMIDAIAWKARGSGLAGLCKFALQVIAAIGRTPERATGSIDLMIDGWKKAAVGTVCEQYKRDVERGTVLSDTPEYVAAMRHFKHAYFQPEVHLRDRIPRLSKGEYKKEWHNSDGLTVEEFLKQYLLDPHSKEEIIKV